MTSFGSESRGEKLNRRFVTLKRWCGSPEPSEMSARFAPPLTGDERLENRGQSRLGHRLRGSEVLPKDLKKEFKELALADAAPQIFKCLAVLKYVLTADLSGIHLCVDSWSCPQEMFQSC